MADIAAPAAPAPETPADVPSSVAPVPAESAPVAAELADAEAPAAKRARAEDGSAVAQAGPAADTQKNPVQSLEELAVQFLPVDRQKELYDILSNFTSELVDTRAINAQQKDELQEKRKELETLRKSHEDQEDKASLLAQTCGILRAFVHPLIQTCLNHRSKRRQGSSRAS